MKNHRHRPPRNLRLPRAGSPSHPRAAFTLFELAISAILLAAVMVSAIPALSWIVRVRQSAERRQAATLEVGNLMEQVAALPWEEITAERLAAVRLTEPVSQHLPAAELKVTVSIVETDPDAKRVFIELRWHESRAESAPTSIRLAAWIYRNAKGVS